MEEIKKRYDSGHSVSLDSVSDPFVVCDVFKLSLRSLSTTYPGYIDPSMWTSITKQLYGKTFEKKLFAHRQNLNFPLSS